MNDATKLKAKGIALKTIRLYRKLTDECHEYVLSKQLLRCGTSIGANLAEAEVAMSRADFVSKIYIALKECNETLYWLELLQEAGFITDEEQSPVFLECHEMLKILISTTRKIKENDPRG